jgi:hypothetical protein
MFYQYVNDQANGIKAFMDQSQIQIDENLSSLQLIAGNKEIEGADFADISH